MGPACTRCAMRRTATHRRNDTLLVILRQTVSNRVCLYHVDAVKHFVTGPCVCTGSWLLMSHLHPFCDLLAYKPDVASLCVQVYVLGPITVVARRPSLQLPVQVPCSSCSAPPAMPGALHRQRRQLWHSTLTAASLDMLSASCWAAGQGRAGALRERGHFGARVCLPL